jgi:hypothetical protein
LNTTITVFVPRTDTTDITRADWDTAWKNYYDERTKLLNAIATKAKDLADAAQGDATTAVDNAATAQSAAEAAQADASTAVGELNDIADDDKVTPVEKLEARQRWDTIVVEGAIGGTIPLQATAFGVADADFDTAYAALDTYLNTTITVFVPMTDTTDITRADWDTAWKNYYDERTKLLNAIATKAKTLADGKTKTFYDDSAPSATTVGDIWYDTNDGNKMYRATATGTANWVNVDLTIIDGGNITTNTIEAGDIKAGTFQAGVIYAGDINAANITTGTLTATTINSATLAGATISSGISGTYTTIEDEYSGISDYFIMTDNTNNPISLESSEFKLYRSDQVCRWSGGIYPTYYPAQMNPRYMRRYFIDSDSTKYYV